MTSSASSLPWQSHGVFGKSMGEELCSSSDAPDTSSDYSSDECGELSALPRADAPPARESRNRQSEIHRLSPEPQSASVR